MPDADKFISSTIIGSPSAYDHQHVFHTEHGDIYTQGNASKIGEDGTHCHLVWTRGEFFQTSFATGLTVHHHEVWLSL